ncbi:GTPase domain-containing protein [Streptacidiphilus melanogenes]|uniref:GTPase domain-containing protein n=1 Tax=Streptacidiphilus melanogenes TaxID=411235 RepID=UPI0005A7348D|nr:GTPase domain-containing protein [Streptacidiphilus melanogenes]
MQRQLTLAELEEYASAVQDYLGTLDQPRDEEEDRQRSVIREAARRLNRRVQAPIALGVVGPFSVGKSLLIGTALGRPGLLPVEERPTTGNITVLTLEQGLRGDGTSIRPETSIRFMSTERLAECVQEIFAQLVEGIEHAGLDLKPRSFLTGYDPVRDPREWARFNSWYRCLWGEPVAGVSRLSKIEINEAHRETARELGRIRDAQLGQHGLLDAPAPLVIHSDRVRAAVELPPPALPDTSAPAPQHLDFGGADLRTDDAVLRASFPLVERIEQTVVVDPEHWDLTAQFGANSVQLVDFPGIGAAGSYGRDRHLSRQTLRDMHSIVVVLPSDHMPSADAQDFWTMLAADRSSSALETAALVVSNKFDRIAVPVVEGAPGSLQAGLERTDCLSSLDAFAPQFVGPRATQDRVHLVSPIRALVREKLAYDDVSDNTRAVIIGTAGAQSTVRSWLPYAAELEQAAPGNPWSARLRAYEEHGGVAAFRQAVGAHVQRHGGDHKLERARRAGQELLGELRKLRLIERRDVPIADDAYARAGGMFQALRQILDEMESDFAVMARLAVDRNGTAVPLHGPAPREAARLAGQVRSSVYDGMYWQQVLGRARNSGDLLVRRSAPPPEDSLDPLAEPTAAAPSDSTEVFERAFLGVLERQSEGIQAEVHAWLEEWYAHWQPQLDPTREWIASDEDSAALLPRVFERHAQDGEAPGRLLARLDLRSLVDSLLRHLPRLAASLPEQPQDRFPLQSRHALPWHTDALAATPTADRRGRHPLAVLQMRAAVADAAADYSTLQLHWLQGRVRRELHQRLHRISELVLETAAFTPPPQRPGDGEDSPGGHAPDGGGPTDPGGDPSGGGSPRTLDELISYWDADGSARTGAA